MEHNNQPNRPVPKAPKKKPAQRDNVARYRIVPINWNLDIWEEVNHPPQPTTN